jgi:hypothetical protein
MVKPADTQSANLLENKIRYTWVKIDNIDPYLVIGGPQGQFLLDVYYRLGKDEEEEEKRLLGQPPDYYFINLNFELSTWIGL